ncbi:N-6 DNA methylase [Paenibacillus crassostreae]|uniref:site-specific DNA-methyltransferase (adenine-specific) n=1 Tax=Paenibacillus crassostreae TaxID=1763538 RepID=A0A167EJ65_9BACL|nr:N-6 DNA methylase [Paenibacillus crassostreae]AOZ94912.1 hypothetical protein LPB68_21875 [Paenibacillus crassostreae]OAB75594.1 hypothetical protein PNBC_08165 [Paenibacillus crassostreae]
MDNNNGKTLYTLDKMRGVLNTEQNDRIIVPLLALRYAYAYQKEDDFQFSISWEELCSDRTGDKIICAMNELAIQKPWIEQGLKLFEVEGIRNLDSLLYELRKVELAKDNRELLEIYFSLSAKNRSKYGVSNEAKKLYEPKEVNELAVKLLDIKSDSSVYDFHAGYGRPLVEAARSNSNISVYGMDANPELVGIAELSAFMCGLQQGDFQQGDVFNVLRNEVGSERKFDYVISHPPLGIKLNEGIHTKYGEIRRDGTLGFVVHALESLKEEGKGIVTVSNGVLFQGSGGIRKELIDNDWIDAVITLPAGIFTGSGLSITMLVINKKKAPERKGKVQVIDASSFGERKRGAVIMSSSELDQIKDSYFNYKEDNKLCRILDISEISQNKYNLLPGFYLQMEDASSLIGEVQIDRSAFEKNQETIKLKDMVRIYRGLNTASGLDTDTLNAKVIQLADVQDGSLHLETVGTYGLKLSTKEEEAEIQVGDVLLTSRGIAMKCAVVTEITNGPYYLSANFIGLRPSQGVNPYFLLTFFESPIGESYIRSLRKGVTLPILNRNDIEDIPIPNLTSEEMEQIGNQYKKVLSDYTEAKIAAEHMQVSQLEQIYRKMGISKGYKRKD